MTTPSAHSTDAARADSGREIVPLGKVATIVSGFGFPKDLQGKANGDLPFFKVADISAAWSCGRQMLTTAQHYLSQEEASSIKAKAFPKGTIVFAKIGEAIKLNRRAILGQAALVDNNVMGLIPDCEVVDHRYLFYWTLTQKLGDISQATTVPSVRKSDVEELEFPLVHLDQQERIVAEIEKQFSRLDKAVANLRRVKANLKRYKAAVLKAAVEGRLVETEAELARREGRTYETGEQLLQRILETRRSQWQGKGKYKEPAAPETTDLPELPRGWVWVAAEQVCDPVASGSTPAAGEMYAGKGEVPFIKVYNLTFDGTLDFTIKPTFIKRATHQGILNRSRVFPGDVLTNIVGPPLGKVSIAPDVYPEWNINQAIVTFRTKSAIGNRLLAIWLMSTPVLRRLERTAKATAGQFNLQVTTCRKLAIPLPPKAEQHSIVAEVDCRLSLLRETETRVDASLQRAERLRQSVLHSSFSIARNNPGDENTTKGIYS